MTLLHNSNDGSLFDLCAQDQRVRITSIKVSRYAILDLFWRCIARSHIHNFVPGVVLVPSSLLINFSDLKPDNILLDERGHAHLTDLNIAVHYSERRLLTKVSTFSRVALEGSVGLPMSRVDSIGTGAPALGPSYAKSGISSVLRVAMLTGVGGHEKGISW